MEPCDAAAYPRSASLYKQQRTIRVAAVGDLHVRERPRWDLAELFATLPERADLLVVAGDITENGRVGEAIYAAEALAAAGVPVYAVLGNHDLRGLRRRAFRQELEAVGVRVLVGEAAVATAAGVEIGIAGVSGSGGGFWSAEDWQKPRGRAFNAVAVRVRREAERLDHALRELHTPVKIVVTHFAPTPTTLGNEPLAKWWMLGNAELGRVIDAHQVDLVVHGHAHLGNRVGETPGGVPVRNAALPVTGGILVLRMEVDISLPTPMLGAFPEPDR
ncbi:MAG: metallophosphoesterase [Thermomicrobiales bacterium]|nr:metallophosphoesterase [Thermomicrobiales bacterium]